MKKLLLVLCLSVFSNTQAQMFNAYNLANQLMKGNLEELVDDELEYQLPKGKFDYKSEYLIPEHAQEKWLKFIKNKKLKFGEIKQKFEQNEFTIDVYKASELVAVVYVYMNFQTSKIKILTIETRNLK